MLIEAGPDLSRILAHWQMNLSSRGGARIQRTRPARQQQCQQHDQGADPGRIHQRHALDNQTANQRPQGIACPIS